MTPSAATADRDQTDLQATKLEGAEIVRLKHTFEARLSELEHALAQLQRLSKDAIALREDRDRLVAQAEAQKSNSGDLERLREEVVSLRGERDTLSACVAGLGKERDELAERCSKLKQALNQSQEEHWAKVDVIERPVDQSEQRQDSLCDRTDELRRHAARVDSKADVPAAPADRRPMLLSRRARKKFYLVSGLMALGVAGIWTAVALVQARNRTQLFSEAVSLENGKQYSFAVEKWLRFLDRYPSDLRQGLARQHLATCYLETKNYDQAISTIEQLISESVTLDQPDGCYMKLGDAYFRRAQKSGRAEDYDRAAAALHVVLENYPESPNTTRALLRSGENFFCKGDLAEAISAYSRLIQEHADDPLVSQAAYARIAVLQKMEADDQVIASCSDFVERFPLDLRVHEVRVIWAELLFDAGQLDLAHQLFALAAGGQGFDHADQALFGVARCLMQRRDFAQAAECFLSLPTRYPNTRYLNNAILLAGKCFHLAKKHDRSREVLEELCRRDGSEAPEALLWTSRAWLSDGNATASLLAAELGITKCSGNVTSPELLKARADAMREIPEHRSSAIEAYADLARKFSESPLAAESLYLASLTALETERLDVTKAKADEFLGRFAAHELAPDVLFLAAECQFRQSRYAEAAQTYRTLVEQFSSHRQFPLSLTRMAEALYCQGKYSEVIALEPMADNLADAGMQRKALFFLGRSYFKQDDFSRACDVLERLVGTDCKEPQQEEALLTLGLAYRRLGKNLEAISKLKQLETAFPQGAYLDETCYRLGEYAYADAQFSEAVNYFERVVANWPESKYAADAHLGLGMALLETQDFARVTDVVGELIRSTPSFAEISRAHYVRGLAEYRRGNLQLAIEDFQVFLDIDPDPLDQLDALYLLGTCHVAVKAYWQATNAFRSIMQKDPNYGNGDRVCYELAWALKELDEQPAARTAFEQLASNYPNSPLAIEGEFQVAELHYAAGEFERAARTYSNVLEKAENDELREKSYHKLGWSYLSLEQFEKAVTAFEAQLNCVPVGELADYASFLVGECEYRGRQWKNAFDRYAKVLADNQSKHTSLALFRSGECAEHLQDWSKSAELYDGLLRQFPDFEQRPEARLGLASALQGQGKIAEAIATYEQVTQETTSATAAKARFLIGECYRIQKNLPEAIRNYLKGAATYRHETWAGLGFIQAGSCFEQVRDKTQAIRCYEAVLEKYPTSPHAADAQQRLVRLANGAKR